MTGEPIQIEPVVKIQKRVRYKQDGVHKWLVLAVSFGCMVVDVGFYNSFGSLFLAVIEDFEATRAHAAAIQSTAFAVCLSAGVVAGVYVKTFGSRTAGLTGTSVVTVAITTSYFASNITYLVISLGIAGALGLSLLLVATTTSTEEYFKGRAKLIAVAVVITGVGVGGMAYPYILIYLNNTYGLNGTFLLVGAISANCIPCCLLWNKRSANNEEDHESVGKHGLNETRVHALYEPCGNKSISLNDQCEKHDQMNDGFTDLEHSTHTNVETADNHINTMIAATLSGPTDGERTQTVTAIKSLKALMKNTSFVAFAIALTLSYTAINITLFFLMDVFADKGYTEADATLGMFILNLVGISGRISPGFFMQIPTLPPICLPISASFLGAVSMVGLIFVPNLAASIVMCGLIGVCQGALVCMYTVAPLRLYGRDHLPTAIGILYTFGGICNTAIGPVSGMIRDQTNSYTIPFYSAAGSMMVGCIMYGVAHATHKEIK